MLRVTPNADLYDTLSPMSDDALLTELSLHCPDCDYDLRGIDSARCPECGADITGVSAGRSNLPWERRKQLGRVRAFFRQSWMALFGYLKLVKEINHPLSLAAARRYRMICAASVAVQMLVVLIVAQLNDMLDRSFQSTPVPNIRVGNPNSNSFWVDFDVVLPWSVGASIGATYVFGILFFAITVTGVHTYWFNPSTEHEERQRRSVALSYYLTGALVWHWIAYLIFAFGVWWDMQSQRNFAGLWHNFAIITTLVGYGCFLFCWFLYYLNIVRLHARLANASFARNVGCAIGVPVAWIATAIIAFGVWPWLVGVVLVWISSFR